MDRPLNTDTVPRQANIVLRQNDVYYYSPGLFHLAPTHEHIVPLTIQDVHNASCVLEIYGVAGMQKHTQGYVMINNYPVQHIKIRGRVLLYTEMNFPYRKPFYFITVEDYLGPNLTVVMKADRDLLKLALSEDQVLEAVGRVSFQSFRTEFLARSVVVKGLCTQFDLECNWWEIVLATRKFLQIPWKYEAPAHSANTPSADSILLYEDVSEQRDRSSVLTSVSDPYAPTVKTFSYTTDCVYLRSCKSRSGSSTDHSINKKCSQNLTFLLKKNVSYIVSVAIADRRDPPGTEILSRTLDTSTTGSTKNMTDPITCHVLDTAIGKPAENVTCSIYYLCSKTLDQSGSESYSFSTESKPFALSKTDCDGRIKNWILDPLTSSEMQSALGFKNGTWLLLQPGIYKIKFLTGKYFYGLNTQSRTFFPYVEIVFEIGDPPDRHYHVPLLLSNFSYSTYRGS